MIVNVVVDRVPDVREELSSFTVSESMHFVFSEEPISADFHVFTRHERGYTIDNLRDRTAFLIAEPPEIYRYGRNFLDQFGAILSPHFSYLRNQSNLIPSQGFLPWQVGLDISGNTYTQVKSIADILRQDTSVRRDTISVITSSKVLTDHQRKRLRFIEFLSSRLPNLEVYGRGFNDIGDKSDILTETKYHLSLENSVHVGYWTEKLTDPLICGSQVFYAGDPSVIDHFPSVIPISLISFHEALDVIQRSLAEDAFRLRIDQRRSDRQKYLEEFNLINAILVWTNSINLRPIEVSPLKIYRENGKFTSIIRTTQQHLVSKLKKLWFSQLRKSLRNL